MALAETARLIASLELQDKFSATASKFDRTVVGMDQRTRRLGQLGEHIGQGVRNTAANVARIGVVAAGALAVNVKAGIDSLAELQRVEQLTATALKSTGSAAGGSAEDIRKRSLALEDMTTLDDKAIQNAQNLLLTFRQIGQDAFEPTLQAAIDLNAAMGGDENSLQGALIQVGKAVNDPIKGLTALRRVGVSFTQQQQDQIKKLVDAGRAMDAQKIILRELNKEFSGAGKAFGTGPAADMRRFGDAIEDAQQALATGFLPLIRDVSQEVQKALADPKVLANIRNFGEGLAGAVRNLIDIGTRLPWDAIGSAAKLMGEGAKGLLQAFTSLPPWIQTAVLTGWGLNKLTGGALGNVFGDVIKLAFPKLDIFSRGSPANPMWVRQVGLPGGGPTGGFKPPSWLGPLAGLSLGQAIGLVAGIAAPIVMLDVIPEIFKGPPGSGPKPLERNLGPGPDGKPVTVKLDQTTSAMFTGLMPSFQQSVLEAGGKVSDSVETESDKALHAAFENNRQNNDLIDEAKRGRLATAHQQQAFIAGLKTIEAKLIHDPSFKPKVDSAAEFIRLLKRTSEFGAKGVGTTIEHGKTTGRDPVGDAFVALVKRLPKDLLGNKTVSGEISRHIDALEQVQGRLLRQGNIDAAKHAQRNIDKLEHLIGEVDKTIPHFRSLEQKQDRQRDAVHQLQLSHDRGIQRTSGLLGQQLGTERNTAINTGIISRKNFSPRVAVTVNSTANVSVDNVIRSVTHTTTALGSGPGGPAPVGII